MVLLAVAALLVQAAPAGARALPAPPNGLRGQSGTNTQMTMSGTGPGRGVSGFIPDATNPFDPVLDGYPASNPTTGFTAKDEGFAGVIFGQPTDGSANPEPVLLRPVHRHVARASATPWARGMPRRCRTWAMWPRILNEYYPFVPTQPAGLANTTEQAAAVQAAIWFFSDRYVLNTSDPLHDTVAGDRGPHHLGGSGHGTAAARAWLSLRPTPAVPAPARSSARSR